MSKAVLKNRQLLSEDFLSKYSDFPEHMEALGKFVYYRTYSRWLPEKGRRETWKETCTRAVNYNMNLASASTSEAEAYFDNMFNLRQFMSGRTLWVGDTPVAEKFPTANFNCSGVVLDCLEAFHDMFYLLLVGTGVGFRILKKDVAKLPKFRTNVELINMPYFPVAKDNRLEGGCTLELLDDHSILLTVSDDKEGWAQSMYYYLKIMSDAKYANITNIFICYDNVRPKGERLKTFGGTASGHESLQTMFTKVHNVLTTDMYARKPVDGILRPIHCLDIANIIGENVVCGGVRRTSEIALLDPDDVETLIAKVNLTTEKYHRFMSNNSVFYEQKPTREQLTRHFNVMRKNGEPGFCNAYAARLRNPKFELPNPCFEALLANHGMCNLVTTNVAAFVKDGQLDLSGLIKAHRLNGRAALRMTLVDLELPEWDAVQKDQRMLGVSLTGWYDMVDKVNMCTEQEVILMEMLKDNVNDEVYKYCDELEINYPVLITLVKPEGTLSQVAGGVSPGIHRSHADYFIRRIRINAHDPLCKTAEALGWIVKNEVGQGIEVNGKVVPVTTKVIEFPVHSGAKTTKYDVTALDQLETYYNFQKHYTEGNTSITITVRPDEWELVEESVWNHWDDVVGVSFLELDTKAYELLPYETTSKEDYEARREAMKPLDENLLCYYEMQLETAGKDFELAADDACSNGVCPVR